MTNRAYITQSLSAFGVSTGKIELILYNAQLDPNGTAEPLVLKRALYDNSKALLNGFTSVSEGGTSLAYDKDSFLRWYSLLCQELGLPNLLGEVRSTISDGTYLW